MSLFLFICLSMLSCFLIPYSLKPDVYSGKQSNTYVSYICIYTSPALKLKSRPFIIDLNLASREKLVSLIRIAFFAERSETIMIVKSSMWKVIKICHYHYLRLK